MNNTSFRLAIEPMPTPRPRARCISVPGRKPIASFYSPKEYQDWQKEAARLLAKIEAFPVEGTCIVSITCAVTKPKTTKLPCPKPDVDNYAKGILDAITKDGRFWADDTQVRMLMVSKLWADPGNEGVYVTIQKDL